MSKEKPNLTQEELLWKIYQSTEKTRKYIMWGRILSVIKILIIAVPIILAIIYLPPLIEKAVEPYKELLEVRDQGKSIFEQINLPELMKKYK